MKSPGPDNYTGEYECEMWDLDHKESWALKNWWFQTVVLEKTLENPLDFKEIQPVHSGNQSWIFIGRTNAEVEAPVLWPPDVRSWLIGKVSDAGKDWGHEEKGETEDKMVGWHHQLNGREFEQTLGDGEGQGSLACCDPCGHKESDTTYQLNNTTNYEIVKEKVVPILYNIFQKSKRKKLNFMGSVLPWYQNQRLFIYF